MCVHVFKYVNEHTDLHIHTYTLVHADSVVPTTPKIHIYKHKYIHTYIPAQAHSVVPTTPKIHIYKHKYIHKYIHTGTGG